MKLSSYNYFTSFFLISLLWLIFLFSGCAETHISQQTKQPVFYPSLPSKPRLQFLTSFSGPENFETSSTNAFERFVLGEPEIQGSIVKPYGMSFYDGKLYVCDVGERKVEVLDLKKRTFNYLTTDKRLTNPVNIYITDDGMKYISDPTAGAIFVFDFNDNLTAILGKGLNIAPIDVAVRDQRCFITDFNSNQVVVIDIFTDNEILRIGSKATAQYESINDVPPGQFVLISDLTLDTQGNIYVTDKAAARITKFDSSGKVLSIIGHRSNNIDGFIRPKGVAVDRENRIWVVDSAPEVTKIYDDKARLLLYFGLPGNEPGNMNLPVKVCLDYNNIEYFRKYIVPGANIEFLVLVSSQYGLNKINVYGFGNFQAYSEYAVSNISSSAGQKLKTEIQPEVNDSITSGTIRPEMPVNRQMDRNEKIADLYYQSIEFYRSGRYEKAREGLSDVLKSGSIPTEMAKSIRQQLYDINNKIAIDKEKQDNADLYYHSMSLYHAGKLKEAQEGFIKVLNSGLIPTPMQETIEGYLKEINNSLMSK